MKPRSNLILLLILAISATYSVTAQEKTSGKSLKEGLFQMNEIDMHVHAGKERPLPLNDWIDLFVKDGRKVMLLLDHLELYRMDDKKNKEWVKKNNFNDWYPDMTTGKYDFIKEMAKVENRNDILVFRGWEIWEGELAVQEAAIKNGRSLSSIKKEEYRYFTPDEQKELIDILSSGSVYIEMESGMIPFLSDPVVREAFTEDILPLVEGGVKFTVSTDAHGTGVFNESYNPGLYFTDLCITPENVNTIIRELLAIRAKKNIR